MDKIFVVQGSTGEYSDRLDWIVKAFRTKEEADKFQQDITDVVEQAWKYLKDNDIDYYLLRSVQFYVDLGYEIECSVSEHCIQMLDSFYESITKLDSKFQCDYTGTFYWVTEVELAGTSNT